MPKKRDVIFRADVIAEASNQEIRTVITGSSRLSALTMVQVLGSLCWDLTRCAAQVCQENGVPIEEFMKAGKDAGKEVR